MNQLRIAGTEGPEPDANGNPIPQELDTPEFREAWTLWNEYRVEAKFKAYKPIGARITLKRLSQWGSSRSVAAIEHSIHMGYQGIFEPRDADKTPPAKTVKAKYYR